MLNMILGPAVKAIRNLLHPNTKPYLMNNGPARTAGDDTKPGRPMSDTITEHCLSCIVQVQITAKFTTRKSIRSIVQVGVL